MIDLRSHHWCLEDTLQEGSLFVLNMKRAIRPAKTVPSDRLHLWHEQEMKLRDKLTGDDFNRADEEAIRLWRIERASMRDACPRGAKDG